MMFTKSRAEDDESIHAGQGKATYYVSDIILGHRYRHVRSGIEGYATHVTFFENACERVSLDYVHEGELKAMGVDAVELLHIDSGQQATVEKPGGPGRGEGSRRSAVGR